MKLTPFTKNLDWKRKERRKGHQTLLRQGVVVLWSSPTLTGRAAVVRLWRLGVSDQLRLGLTVSREYAEKYLARWTRLTGGRRTTLDARVSQRLFLT